MPPPPAALSELRQRPAQIAHGLVDALLVLDEGKTHVPVTAWAETDTRRRGDVGLVDQELGEIKRSHLPVWLWNGRPHEHGPLGRHQLPADAVQALTERVAARG